MTRGTALILIAVAGTLGAAQAVPTLGPLIDPASKSNGPDVAPRAAPRPVAPPIESVRPGNPLWAIPLQQLANTRERPIFSPSRRPPPRIVADIPRVAPPARAPRKPIEHERPPLLLLGTVIGRQESIGVFVDDATKDTVRLRTGETHKGWILRTVEPREATLEKNREIATIALPQPQAERAAAAQPAPDKGTRSRRR